MSENLKDFLKKNFTNSEINTFTWPCNYCSVCAKKYKNLEQKKETGKNIKTETDYYSDNSTKTKTEMCNDSDTKKEKCIYNPRYCDTKKIQRNRKHIRNVLRKLIFQSKSEPGLFIIDGGANHLANVVFVKIYSKRKVVTEKRPLLGSSYLTDEYALLYRVEFEYPVSENKSKCIII